MKLNGVLFITLVAVVLLGAGCAGRTAAQPPIDNGPHLDAEAYAEVHGTSVEEAVRRLSVQDDLGDLQERLATEETAIFGGLWIEHEPEYRVVVAFTRHGARTLRRYVKGTPLDGVAEAREVVVTLAELEAAQASLIALLEEIGSGANTGIDIMRNCVSLYVAEQAAFEAQLAGAGRALPEVVCIEEVGPYPEPPTLEPVPGLAFPRQDPPEGVFAEMMALFIGELFEENGCLRVRGEAQDPGLLVIWPYDHTLTVDAEGRPEVRDGEGAVVARVGDRIEMGGGQSPSLISPLAETLPSTCPGPYWIAARGIRSTQ